MIVDWPLAGRDELLARCGDLLGAPGTHAIVLAGDAGMGKTRLLGECARHAEGAGFAVFRATAHRSSTSIPFGALAPLLPAGQDMIASGVPLLRQAGDALTDSAGGPADRVGRGRRPSAGRRVDGARLSTRGRATRCS